MAGLFKTVEENAKAQTTVTAVFGATKSGRTHQIINRVLERGEGQKILWLTFGNLNFEDRVPDNWVTSELPTWSDFDKGVLIPFKTGKIVDELTFAPNVVVVDGLDIAANFYYSERIKALGEKYAQPIYGEIGPVMRSALATLKSRCSALFFSMTTRDTVDMTGTAATKFTLNDDAVQKIIPMANNLVFTSAKVQREKTGAVVGTHYLVQTTSNLAINFVHGQSSN